MPNNSGSSKDFWDKLEIFGKIVSGIVLVIIAIILERGSDRIASSLQSGELVQSLIKELSTPDTEISQEIALVALNHSIGAQNPTLVLDICERILRNAEYDDISRTFAFEIIQQRAPDRATTILEDFASTKEIVAAVTDSTSMETAAALPIRDRVVNKLVEQFLSEKVYIHFRHEANRSLIAQLQKEFQNKGFIAPGIEFIDLDFNNYVKYYYEDDRNLAENVASIATQFFSARNIPIKFIVQNLTRSKLKERAARKMVELWINLGEPETPVTADRDKNEP
ncbi:hypothetical protein JXJ21_25910 [candidate division KSB1 bacterium]|nr:hypothetical protein [candidate division KSB1 bacterium]